MATVGSARRHQLFRRAAHRALPRRASRRWTRDVGFVGRRQALLVAAVIRPLGVVIRSFDVVGFVGDRLFFGDRFFVDGKRLLDGLFVALVIASTFVVVVIIASR